MKADRRYLPYVLEPVEDNKYSVLNRDYMPIGFGKNDDVDRSLAIVEIHDMNPIQIDRMRHPEHSKSDDAIFFFDDGSAPWKSKSNMEEYMKRLAVFFSLETSR